MELTVHAFDDDGDLAIVQASDISNAVTALPCNKQSIPAPFPIESARSISPFGTQLPAIKEKSTPAPSWEAESELIGAR